MEFALNLAVAVFHIVGRDAEGSVHININIQVAVASIYIDLVEVAGEVFDGKCAVAQIIHVDVLFQLVHFAFSVFQFHVTAVQPVDMDVAIFGFDIHRHFRLTQPELVGQAVFGSLKTESSFR